MFKDDNQLDDFFGYKPEDNDKVEAQKNKKPFFSGLSAKVRLFSKLLAKRERYIIFTLLLLILGSLIAIPFTTYNHFTTIAPDYGSSFSEGLIGTPRYINPLLAQASDTDRDMVSLIYSGLLKYNADGKLVPDLAKSYDISSDGLNYTIYLKQNASWHDGEPVTIDDIIFTVRTAQNQDYGSIETANWSGVDIERVDDYTLIFKLNNKYAQFLNNLTLNILPQHIWQDIKPINFNRSEFNLKPIGSGPFQFSKLKKDKDGQIVSYELASNKNFYDGRPYIDKIVLNFYGSEDELIDAYNKNDVENIGYISSSNLSKVKFQSRLNINELQIPRYFAAFFNSNKSDLLANKNIRLALAYATDKQAIINKILAGYGQPVDSPLIGGLTEVNKDVKKYAFDSELAKKVLAESGWSAQDESGILYKGKQKLSVKLTTSTWPELTGVAEELKEQWSKIGFEVSVESLPMTNLQQAIRERNYEVLIFGEILNVDPDPFSLWHSSQKKERGLNLALYDNKTADTILEQARQTLNPVERLKMYDDFQQILIEDIPAIFLYNPDYIYCQTKDIKGFGSKIISMPSDRFLGIEKWYINTERVSKQ